MIASVLKSCLEGFLCSCPMFLALIFPRTILQSNTADGQLRCFYSAASGIKPRFEKLLVKMPLVIRHI
jgi:hypothetical protein